MSSALTGFEWTCLAVAAVCAAVIGTSFAWASSSDPPPDYIRFAVVAANNDGTEDDEPLLYADDEARRVAELLVDVGTMEHEHVQLVVDASPGDLADALGRTVVKAAPLKEAGRPVAILVYYTGHAGSDGLHMDGEVLSHEALKASVRVVPADLRLFVIDACQSGSLFRSKGARLLDLSTEPEHFTPPRDEVWLTSSGPEEQSFEVDRRRGALFTHFFVSGARGAADADGDRSVTLQEVVEFVSRQTTATAASLGQLQQPRWGGEHGSVVVGDLRDRGTGVDIAGPVAEPVLVIRRDRERVVAEMPAGAGGFLALPPGKYQLVAADRARRPRLAEVVVREGEAVPVELATHLVQVAGVRSKGGLILRHPGTLAAGYRLTAGETWSGAWAHGAYAHVGRCLGRGHRLGFAVTYATAAFHNEYAEGRDHRLVAALQWSHDLAWRVVHLGPGVRVGGGWLRQDARRLPSEDWGEWYGSDPGEHRGDLALFTAQGGVFFGVPLGRLEIQVAATVGAQMVFADQPVVQPGGGLEVGLGVRL